MNHTALVMKNKQSAYSQRDTEGDLVGVGSQFEGMVWEQGYKNHMEKMLEVGSQHWI
jgi:hypothetical protein